jgi:hypothetical protein
MVVADRGTGSTAGRCVERFRLLRRRLPSPMAKARFLAFVLRRGDDMYADRIAIPGSGRCSMAAALAVAAWLAAADAAASVLTLADCLEGSDFIANAAMSRDNGMSRAAFLDRLEQDLFAIRAFPSELRWFAKDEDDEQFLHAAAEDVFDVPALPQTHRALFLRACFDRLTG